MQTKTSKVSQKRASTPKYVSPNQLVLAGYETPFAQKLTSENMWIRMSQSSPWDKIVGHYDNLFKFVEGRPPISGRVILGAMMIKHIDSLTDRGTIQHIQENMFMQYFLAYSSFTNEAPFSDTLFVEIRKRLSLELLSKINDIIAIHCIKEDDQNEPPPPTPPEDIEVNDSAENDVDTVTAGLRDKTNDQDLSKEISSNSFVQSNVNRGKLITDATVAPQNITYPTDLKLLNASREKSEELIDRLYNPSLHGEIKVRTYRKIAKKEFLNTAKKKSK
jgi:hypothetical protein